jgi:hypothetical protein
VQTRVLVPRSRTESGNRGSHARARGGTPTAGQPRTARRARPPVRRCAFGVRIEALRPLPPGSLPDKPAMPLKCRNSGLSKPVSRGRHNRPRAARG